MRLTKAKKRVLMTAGILLILILSGYALIQLLVPRYIVKQEVLYTYSSKGMIDYKVYLKPNIMYKEKYLEKGRYYVLKYIDHVDMNFNYTYTSTAVADLKTEYNVTAYLQGLHGEENEVLWSQEYVLVPSKVERKNHSKISITFNMPVSLNDYSIMKENLYLDSEVNSPAVLNIVFKIHTVAAAKNGTLEDTMSPNLVIPVGSNVFKMEGQPETAGENKIVKNIRNTIPVNREMLYLLFGGSFALLVMVILLGLAREAVPPDEFERSIANIFKEYSERLAGMEHTISYQFSDIITVSSIEDMIKIADEVGQPVFYYKVNSSMERKIEFFVFDSSRIYYMVIFGEIKPGNEDIVPSGKG